MYIIFALSNSIIVATGSMVLTVFFSSMAGFAFAKYRFRFEKLAFNLIIATMLVPMEIGLVAFILEMRVLHLSQTFLPLILPNIASAFGVFLMNSFIQEAVPFEIMESSRIDGCNNFMVFIRLVFTIPLVIATLGNQFVADYGARIQRALPLEMSGQYAMRIKFLLSRAILTEFFMTVKLSI